MSKLEFSKEEVSDTPKTKSSLAHLLSKNSPLTKNSPRRILKKDDEIEETKKEDNTSIYIQQTEDETQDDSDTFSEDIPFTCKVFFPTKKVVTVYITEECTIDTLLTNIAKNCRVVANNNTGGSSSGNNDNVGPNELASLIHHVELVPANDQGERDSDCPALDNTRPIHQFGVKHFLIRKNKTSEVDLSVVQPVTDTLWIGTCAKKHTVDPTTRLFLASETGKLGEVRRLVEHAFADVNALGINNFTALHFACRCGHLTVVNYLIKQSAQIDALTKNKWTPLHLACDKGHIDIVETLLTCGADPDIKDTCGNDAMYYAEQKKFTDIVQLIKEFKT